MDTRTILIALLLAVATLANAQGMPGMGQSQEQQASDRSLVQQMQEMMQQMQRTLTGSGDETSEQMTPSGQMGMPGMQDAPSFPPVPAFADGSTISFIHSEASDPDIAQTLSFMMGSPVAVVPALADAPEEMLAEIYVFTNGVSGMGPMGFQLDVLDHMPGESGYTPLRRVSHVSWSNPQQARVLRSATEIEEAQAEGLVTIETTEVVINAPVLQWRLGRR